MTRVLDMSQPDLGCLRPPTGSIFSTGLTSGTVEEQPYPSSRVLGCRISENAMATVPEFHRSGHVTYLAPAIFDLDSTPQVIDDIEYLSIWSPWVALDLSRVEFMNSAAVTVLVWARRRLRSLGGELVLVGPPPLARSVLSITGALAVFPAFDTLDELPERHPTPALANTAPAVPVMRKHAEARSHNRAS
jgi:anti-sigma B factor antagonist